MYIRGISVWYTNRNSIDQVLRSWTSIGANYYEANWASSKKYFRNKIYICKKEAKETVYWLELLLSISQYPLSNLKKLLDESKEIMCIFNKIAQKVKTY